MKKKIILIGNTSWGMIKFRSELMRDFLNGNHEVIVISPKDPSSADITSLGCRHIDIEIDRKGTNPIKDICFTVRLIQILIHEKPDILLNYTIKPILYGSVASWFSGVPCTIAITTGLGYTFSENNWINRFTKFLYRHCLRFSSQVWFLNQEDRETFLKEKLIPVSKSFVLPGEGVDVEFYKPQPKEVEAPRFTLISRMLWDKGVGIFADCAEELKKLFPDLVFQIVGPIDHGNPRSIPLVQLKEWNEKGFINYLGPLDDVREILQSTTCLIHPTYYREGVPRVLMEANSMEIPCITTNIAGCRDVIEDNINGFLIKPNDKEDLKEAILKFLQLDEAKKLQMGKMGRKNILDKYSSNLINEIYRSKLSL